MSARDIAEQNTILEREIEDLLEHSPLPARPDHDTVNQWLVSAYTRWWKEGSDERS